jgi:hypothetical protein
MTFYFWFDLPHWLVKEIHVKTRDDLIISKTAKYEMIGISSIIRNNEWSTFHLNINVQNLKKKKTGFNIM